MPSKDNKNYVASGSHLCLCEENTKAHKKPSKHKSKNVKRRTKSPFCAGFHYSKQPIMKQSSSSSEEDSSEEESSSDEEEVRQAYTAPVDPRLYQYYGMPMATPEMYGYMPPPMGAVAYNYNPPTMYPQPLYPNPLWQQPMMPDRYASCPCGLAPIKEPSMMQAYSAHQYPPNKPLDPRFGPYGPMQ